MKSFCLLLTSCVLLARLNATIIYVNSSATGANNGASWTDAFTDLQNGISATLPGDTIWVAQGVYKPTTTTTRSISFVLPDGVKTFGGFNGTEVLLSQRNFNAYATILSGDIGVTGNSSDNSYNVVKTNTVSSATRLDGFKIISGNCTGGSGGGLFNSTGSPVIANCIFEYNQANNGAAVTQFNTGGMSFINCIFRNNSAVNNGGAVEARAGNFTMTGCELYTNVAGLDGGAMYLYGGIITVDRCSMSGNTAAVNGGAVFGGSLPSQLILLNSLIAGNSATNFSAIDAFNSNAQYIINCTIADNKANSSSSTCVSVNGTSEIDNSVFWGNSEAYEITLSSVAVNYCIVEGGFTGSGANHIMTANPGFISPGNYLLAPFAASGYDYHTGLFSPVVDAGNNSYLVPIYNFDLDNNARVHGPAVDLGCYENPYCTFNLSIIPSGPTSICPSSSVTLTASSGTNYIWSDSSTTASITTGAAGTYILHADSSGCLGTDSVQVTILNASVNISGNPNLCNNDSVLLTATGANIVSWLWSTNDTTAAIYVNTPATYSVTVTTIDGCTAGDTYIVSDVTPVPVITYTGGVLSTTTFTSYQWLLNNSPVTGATGSTFSPSQNGNYSVIVTNSFGCSDTSAIYVVSDVGMAEYNQLVFGLSPDPCTDLLHLTGNIFTSGITITVTDISGRQVISPVEATESVHGIAVTGLPGGIYFITVKSQTASSTLRFVKE